MNALLRFLGLGNTTDAGRAGDGETPTVRRIASALERLDPDEARKLAGFAYVMARVAHADLRIDDDETDAMHGIVRDGAALSDEEAALVVEIAKSQARVLGGTDNYTVTREYRKVSTKEERARLLSCIYAVAAADGNISSTESAEIATIAEELGFTRAEANSVRAQYRDKLSVLQDLPQKR